MCKSLLILDLILPKLTDHINLCIEKWKLIRIYAPIAVICQSSGYGKSRSLYEYAKNNISTFICLRGPDDSGCPPSSNLRKTFIESLEHPVKAEKVLLAMIQTSVEFYDMIVEK